MRRRFLALVAVLLCALAVPVLATATPFTATYTFTGSPGNQASEPVDLNPLGATFADITRGSGLTAVAAANSINSSGWSLGALDANDYYQFIATPDANHQMDLTSLAFSERRSGTGIMTFEIRTSLDAFSSSIYTFATPDNLEVRRHTVALGPAFEDLTAPITFRFFAYEAGTAAGTWRLGVSGGPDNPNGFAANLQVAGDLTAVPEPATLLLLSLGLGGIAMRSRRVLNL